MDQSGVPAIETRNLRKVYGGKVAVSSLSLTVARGSIFGLLGPNGAGKSTTIKMLLGLVKPAAGEAFLFGAAPSNVEVRRKIGFLPEHFRFYEWLTPAELLHFHGRLCGMSAGQLRECVPALLELVGLTPHREKRLSEFSKGMLQRVGLAQALVHDPELVFLDEPTSGLDPFGRRLVRDIIRAQRDRGATVFLNSHLLGEVELICDRVAFMKDGEVVASRILGTNSGKEVRVRARVRGLSQEALTGLARWQVTASQEGEHLILTLRSAEALPDVVRHLVAAGTDVYELTPERTSLEDLFVRIIGQDRGL